MIKITVERIEERGWRKREFSATNTYVSPNDRYELQYNNDFSNLTDGTGFGWAMFIYNSTEACGRHHHMIGCCDVEYMEQIDALIEIYKDY